MALQTVFDGAVVDADDDDAAAAVASQDDAKIPGQRVCG